MHPMTNCVHQTTPNESPQRGDTVFAAEMRQNGMFHMGLLNTNLESRRAFFSVTFSCISGHHVCFLSTIQCRFLTDWQAISIKGWGVNTIGFGDHVGSFWA